MPQSVSFAPNPLVGELISCAQQSQSVIEDGSYRELLLPASDSKRASIERNYKREIAKAEARLHSFANPKRKARSRARKAFHRSVEAAEQKRSLPSPKPQEMIAIIGMGMLRDWSVFVVALQNTLHQTRMQQSLSFIKKLFNLTNMLLDSPLTYATNHYWMRQDLVIKQSFLRLGGLNAFAIV